MRIVANFRMGLQGIQDSGTLFRNGVPFCWLYSPIARKRRKKLDKQESGIKIECKHDESAFSYEIVQTPEKLNVEVVQALIQESFVEIVNEPWIFETGLK